MSATTTIQVEELAARALRDWLLYALPGAVERVNSDRRAELHAGKAGPYTIPPTSDVAHFNLGTTKGVAAAGAPVTDGDYTAAELVTAFNNGTPYDFCEAFVDDIGRFAVRTLDGVVNGKKSLYLGQELTAGFNAALGWPAENFVMRWPLATPKYDDILDGWPPLWGPTGPVAVVLGDRKSKPGERRSDQYETRIDVSVLVRCQQGEGYFSRETIHAGMRAVRTALFDVASNSGRQLGRAATGDVVRVEEADGFVRGAPFRFGSNQPFFEGGVLNLVITTYERQAFL